VAALSGSEQSAEQNVLLTPNALTDIKSSHGPGKNLASDSLLLKECHEVDELGQVRGIVLRKLVIKFKSTPR
jgi:hypothetical protein